MVGLNLVPNETVGYRIRPDFYNWDVEEVKRHGSKSKTPGEQYSRNLGHFKTLANAASYIFNLHLRVQGAANQDAVLALSGELASLDALMDTVSAAHAEVMKAVEELEQFLAEAGISRRDIAKLVRAAGAADEGERAGDAQ
jgi:hypothetical protein